jgi:hypothetical protein
MAAVSSLRNYNIVNEMILRSLNLINLMKADSDISKLGVGIDEHALGGFSLPNGPNDVVMQKKRLKRFSFTMPIR